MTRKTVSALCVLVVIAGSVVAVSAPAGAGLPSGATPVHATSGVVTKGIDASVTPLGAISGRITSVKDGKPVPGAVVLAVGEHGRVFSSAYSWGGGYHGRYLMPDLIPGRPYRICVYGTDARGGGSASGYLSRCYKSDAWSGRGAPPGNAAVVTVSAGVKTTGIDVALPSAAAIAGAVTNDAGTALAHVQVKVRNWSTGERISRRTDATGQYLIKGLTPARGGYAVCFDAYSAPHSPTGYLDECWKNQAWAGGRIPRDARPIQVHRGTTHTGINAVLDPGGAIAGRLTDAVTGDPIQGIVGALSATGKWLTGTFAGPTGHYVIQGLGAARTDYVCAEAPHVRPGTRYRYRNECYHNVRWSGVGLPSSGLTGVGVRPSRVHDGINLALGRHSVPKPKRGSIAGVITSGVDGTTPIRNADVVAIGPHGRVLGETYTRASGAYRMPGLPALSTGYIVCATPQDGEGEFPTSDWAPRCYKDTRWDGGRRFPAHAVKVPLAAGQAKTGVNITLPVSAAISGHVTVSGTTNPALVFVAVFNANTGRLIDEFENNPVDGSYKISGLNAGDYIVCFDGRDALINSDKAQASSGSDGRQESFGSAPYGTRPQCFNNIAWRGHRGSSNSKSES